MIPYKSVHIINEKYRVVENDFGMFLQSKIQGKRSRGQDCYKLVIRVKNIKDAEKFLAKRTQRQATRISPREGQGMPLGSGVS